ncbi:nuclear fragile X mental retardation-interacting protein 1-domain-containing protein, partial [Amylocystis lapponica]
MFYLCRRCNIKCFRDMQDICSHMLFAASHGYPSSVAGPSTFQALAPPGSMAVHAVTAALSDPYVQNYPQFQYPQAPHYAQAYNQYHPSGGPYAPRATPEGYTLSSTYAPGSHYGAQGGTLVAQSHSFQGQQSRGQAPPQWYQPGTCRCTQPRCSFAGSQKALEIHKMDRHLINPPGWETRKRKQDWDADPSLKGKPVPIQGTTVKLDTPEAIADWIAERKRRFPTASRVEEKEKKLGEAIARGQLSPEDLRFPQRKRRRLDDDQQGAERGGRGRGRGRGRDRGGGRGRGGADRGWQTRPSAAPAASGQETANPPVMPIHGTLPAKPPPSVCMPPALGSGSDGDTSSGSDADDAPEMVSSKAIPPSLDEESPNSDLEVSEEVPAATVSPNDTSTALSSPKHRQPPRRQPRNPFAARPSLLRNLLLPEIRMTVSNLSQAIRFLVDNDFLENVEIKAGQASEKMIEVVGQSSASNA